jgi:hypothetical protein
MRMKLAIGLVAAAAWLTTAAAQSSKPTALTLDVYKSPTCGCCAKWVDHMKEAGFTVKVTEKSEDALDAVKTSSGVPQTAQSCHTALAGGYFIEGHVPAADVKRLLQEKPALAGIAVPGMPTGSPGMEVPGVAPQAFKVIAFDKKGTSSVFASHGGR